MKSVFFSRFFILLPWVLIVIIMIDIDSKRAIRVPVAGRTGRAQRAARTPGAQNQSALPVIYAITPTYTRPVQKAELTRLAHAFRQVPRFHWIVVEDSSSRTDLVARFLARSGVPFTHLNIFTPRRFKRAGMPRATEQRNVALAWLRQHRSKRDPGVVFFADDDNTYSLELFEEMRSTRGVSIWPVGFVGGRSYERPLVSGGKVVGWYTGWRPDRPFATDMAGFAVNLQVILANPRAQFKRRGSQPGMQESDFLKQITKVTELEPKANNCTRLTAENCPTNLPSIDNDLAIQVRSSLGLMCYMCHDTGMSREELREQTLAEATKVMEVVVELIEESRVMERQLIEANLEYDMLEASNAMASSSVGTQAPDPTKEDSL